MLYTCDVETPIGRLGLVASDLGLTAILWPSGMAVGDTGGPSPMLELAVSELQAYFAGESTRFSVPLDVAGTPFQQQAWDALRAIPFGETLSYGEQAEVLGRPRASRAVGGANARNPVPIVVPCHRVVAADGGLGGFAGGCDVKAWLLAHERRVADTGARTEAA